MPKIEKNEKEILEDIKNLLILQLAKTGATDEEVAKALNCGTSTLRKKVSFAGNKKKNG
ncbi:MAG: helix-turn-helix domain-containing protein [Candidatus Woesearchaeota archaeon]|nr:helix-turn-helix domain-containing protein [Candidatus Woesearchaeota archaeon]